MQATEIVVVVVVVGRGVVVTIVVVVVTPEHPLVEHLVAQFGSHETFL